MIDAKELGNAARNGHREVVQLLLDPKYNNVISSSSCQSAIREAAAGGHQGIISVLIQHNELKSLDNIQDRILQSASFHSQEEFASTALDNGANPNVMRHPISPWITPLDAAAKHGFRGIVQLLLERGATQRPCR
jgi:ankyrin repeat protein